MDFTAVDKRIAALEATRAKPCKVSPTEPLAVGLDLGTAYIVLAVVDSRQRPVACAVQSAQVVRDGLVVDYAGGLRMVRALREQLEDSLGRKLEKTAIAVPPGTGERDCATHRHVAEGAGLEVTALLDEPTAANNVLGVRDGAIVDIGGGTTGIAVLRGGQVTYVADEPTGGTHLSLVLAGNYDVDFEAAEALKKDPARQRKSCPWCGPSLKRWGPLSNAMWPDAAYRPSTWWAAPAACQAWKRSSPDTRVLRPASPPIPFWLRPWALPWVAARPPERTKQGL